MLGLQRSDHDSCADRSDDAFRRGAARADTRCNACGAGKDDPASVERVEYSTFRSASSAIGSDPTCPKAAARPAAAAGGSRSSAASIRARGCRPQSSDGNRDATFADGRTARVYCAASSASVHAKACSSAAATSYDAKRGTAARSRPVRAVGSQRTRPFCCAVSTLTSVNSSTASGRHADVAFSRSRRAATCESFPVEGSRPTGEEARARARLGYHHLSSGQTRRRP
jgi:hypothetical protein